MSCEYVSAPGRIRTCDTGFRRAVLYPLSYEGGTLGAYRAAMFPLVAQRKHCTHECNTESQG
jgi:hypothetical protein